MTALLDIEGLCVDIPLRSGVLHGVRDVSLSVQAGETLGLVGESGCGKSLSLLSIIDLLPRSATRTARRLTFDGINLLGMSESKLADIRGNRIAMIFQEPMTSLNPSLTIGRQLQEVYLRHRGGSRRAARERAIYLLEEVGIRPGAERLHQYPHQLSGGLRQRVMIAMALMCEPKLILADEPTTALDVTIQAQILHLLVSLCSKLGMALVLVTHDLGIVARVADKVAVMYGGQVVEAGPVMDVFTNPVHPYTQGLMNCIPIPGRTRRGEPLGSIPGLVTPPIGPQQGCGFRNRCPVAISDCAEGEIPLTEDRPNHQRRCIVAPQPFVGLVSSQA